jgi:hypothetical protein
MPVVDTTTPFSNNEQITSTKLNNIMDNSFFVSGAVVPSSGLEVTAGGQMQIPNSGITTALIGNDQVITSKIPNLAVTAAKLASSLDLSSKTITLPNNSVTAEKLDGAQTGTAPIFGVRAWGSFNGSESTPITPAGSGNVASIIRLSAASYRVTFTTAMLNQNYAVSFGSIAVLQSNAQANATTSLTAKTTTSFDFSFAATAVNPTLITFMVVG